MLYSMGYPNRIALNRSNICFLAGLGTIYHGITENSRHFRFVSTTASRRQQAAGSSRKQQTASSRQQRVAFSCVCFVCCCGLWEEVEASNLQFNLIIIILKSFNCWTEKLRNIKQQIVISGDIIIESATALPFTSIPINERRHGTAGIC